ncbi:MAG: aminoacyl-tRNA hydrolase [Verrucomicrobia bacterium]|nr:aminoacyl-tRNA hydrolase [Verrucomicrobiota bacterium]
MGDIQLVVGLGNPGREYGETRHNVGYRVVEKLAADAGARWQRAAKFEAEIAEAHLAGRKIVLAKPMTFMNLSGRACVALLHWHKFAPDQMLVVTDDADLDVGRLRLRLKGSSGGHNGLKSIGELVGAEQFPRVRIGIGRPMRRSEGAPENALVDFVLSRFRKEELAAVGETVARAAEAVACAIERGMAAAMNEFNG